MDFPIEAFERKANDPVPEWALPLDDPIKLDEAMQSVPLFTTDINSSKRNKEGSVALDALQALLYDGSPYENALNFKEQGNESYKEGSKEFLRSALVFYSKGLEEIHNANLKSDTAENEIEVKKLASLKSTLLLNLSAANFELGNYRSCIGNIQEYLKCDFVPPEKPLLKAFLRLCKAFRSIDCLDEATSAIQYSMLFYNKSKEIAEEQDCIQKLKEHKQKTKKMQLIKARADKLLEFQICNERKINLNKQFSDRFKPPPSMSDLPTCKIIEKPFQEYPFDKALTFPVFFLYPVYSNSDIVSEFHENCTFEDILNEILNEESVWDPSNIYKGRSNAIVGFYNAADEFVTIDKSCTLLSVLTRKDYILYNCIPYFEIIPLQQQQ